MIVTLAMLYLQSKDIKAFTLWIVYFGMYFRGQSLAPWMRFLSLASTVWNASSKLPFHLLVANP